MTGELSEDPLLLRWLLDAVGQAVIAMDLLGTVVYWNAAAEQMYGWTVAEAIGQPLGELLVGQEMPADQAEIISAVLAGQTWTGESWVRRKDGSRFPVLVTDSPVRDRDGMVVGIVGVSADNSERHAVQRALLLREAQFRRRFTDSSLPQAVLGLDGLISAVNPSMCHWLGYSEQELLHTSAAGLLVPEDRPQFAVDAAILLRDEPHSVESVRRYLHRDGSVLCGLASGMLVTDDDDKPLELAMFVQDITEQRGAEEALRASEAVLRARFEQSSVPQLSLDMSRRITAVNSAFCLLLGGTPEDFLGQSSRSLLPTDAPRQISDDLDRLLAAEHEASRIEFDARRRDGGLVSCLAHLTLLRSPAGVPSGVECHLQDLTTLRTAEDNLRRQDALIRALAANAADIALVVERSGRVRYVSPSAAQVLTVAEGDVVDLEGLSTVHPDDRAAVWRHTAEVFAEFGASVTMTYRSLDRSGEWRWVEQVVTNHEDDPVIAGLVLNLRDVDERVRAEQALRASEVRYRLIAETAQEGIWITDQDGATLYANRRLAELLGRTLEDVYRFPSHLLGTSGSSPNSEIHDRTRRRHEIGSEQFEVSYAHPDGAPRILHVSASPFSGEDGEPIGSLAMITDVTEARTAEDELRRQALYDSLTGLPNRTLLLERLQRVLVRHGRDKKPVAVLLADLDQFKLINDSLGHAVGDALLVTLAGRLSALVRPKDTVARMGGDEFLVLCPDLDEAAAQHVAARLLAALAEPVQVGVSTITVSASIGVAISPPSDAETLVGQADAAMYEAKARGRARVRMFDTSLADQARRRLELSNDLRRALAQDKLMLYYQPVVDLRSGEVVGVEALSRWSHPRHGMVPPTEFVTVAEQSGLVTALDHWVIRQACQDAAEMRATGVLPLHAYVAVNLSARSLGDESLEGVLRAAANECGLPFEALVLEVTESGVMDDPDKVRVQLENLRSLGASFSIDDFGTGYSSLAYLRRFPVSTLKIDRSFVTNITKDPDDLAVVAAIIDLARALSLSTVAEGIETAAELALLAGLGCTAGQGYLWSPAVPPQRLAAVLAQLPQAVTGVVPAARPPDLLPLVEGLTRPPVL